MSELKFTSQLTLKEYLKLNYYILIKKRLIIIMLIIAVANLFSVFYLFQNESNGGVSMPIYAWIPPFVLPFILLIIIPLLTYVKAKKNYSSPNLRFSESILYSISSEWIELKGESFSSKFSWDKIMKVAETKSWFLIYQNKISINVILKDDLDLDECETLRAIIKGVPKLKYHQSKQVVKQLYYSK